MKLWHSLFAAFLLSIFTIPTTTVYAAVDSETATAAATIAHELERLASDSKIVLLGESSHGLPDSLYFLTDFLMASIGNPPTYLNRLSFIALDISTDYQAELDAIAFEPEEAPTIANALLNRMEKDSGKKLFPETRQAYLRLFRKIGWINEEQRTLGQPTVQLVAIDLPVISVETVKGLNPKKVTAEGHRFARRDEFMFETLQKVSDDFQHRGVVLASADHTIKMPFLLPRIAKVTLGLDGELKNLGSRLVEQLGPDMVTSAWLDSKAPVSESFAFVPPDYRKMFSWISGLGGERPYFMPTEVSDQREFGPAYRERLTDFVSTLDSHKDASFSLHHSADYIVKLPSWLGVLSRCESFFSPKNWARGLVLRASSLMPMRSDSIDQVENFGLTDK